MPRGYRKRSKQTSGVGSGIVDKNDVLAERVHVELSVSVGRTH